MTIEVKCNMRHFLFTFLLVYINLEEKSERITFRDVCEPAWVVLWRTSVGHEGSVLLLLDYFQYLLLT